MEQPFSEKKVTIVRNAINYDLMLGVALVIISLLLYILNVKNNSLSQYISLAIMIVGMIIGILNYKKNINGGFISYGKSLGTGVLIGLFASIVLAIYTFVFFTFIDPDLIKEILLKAEDQMVERNPQLTQGQIDIGMYYTKMFTQPWLMSLALILQMTFISFIASLIISIFTQKKDISFESNFN